MGFRPAIDHRPLVPEDSPSDEIVLFYASTMTEESIIHLKRSRASYCPSFHQGIQDPLGEIVGGSSAIGWRCRQ